MVYKTMHRKLNIGQCQPTKYVFKLSQKTTTKKKEKNYHRKSHSTFPLCNLRLMRSQVSNSTLTFVMCIFQYHKEIKPLFVKKRNIHIGVLLINFVFLFVIWLLLKCTSPNQIVGKLINVVVFKFVLLIYKIWFSF